MANNTERLRLTQRLLADEYEKMQHASKGVEGISENFGKIDDEYTKYGDKIGVSQRLVKEIQAKERWEERKLYGSFYIFVLTAAYLFLKRFYLEEILFTTFWLITTLISFLYKLFHPWVAHVFHHL